MANITNKEIMEQLKEIKTSVASLESRVSAMESSSKKSTTSRKKNSPKDSKKSTTSGKVRKADRQKVYDALGWFRRPDGTWDFSSTKDTEFNRTRYEDKAKELGLWIEF